MRALRGALIAGCMLLTSAAQAQDAAFCDSLRQVVALMPDLSSLRVAPPDAFGISQGKVQPEGFHCAVATVLGANLYRCFSDETGEAAWRASITRIDGCYPGTQEAATDVRVLFRIEGKSILLTRNGEDIQFAVRGS